MKYLYIEILLLMSVSLSEKEAIQGLWQTGRENTKIEILQNTGEWVDKIKSTKLCNGFSNQFFTSSSKETSRFTKIASLYSL